MKNASHNTVNVANSIRHLLAALICVVLLTSVSAALPLTNEVASDATWQQHTIPAANGTNVLAITANPRRSIVVLLYRKSTSDHSQLQLAVFDGTGKQIKTIDLAPQLLAAEQPLLYERTTLAIDANDLVYIVAASHGEVHLASVDIRGAVAPFSKTLKIGDGNATISALRLSRGGKLILAGSIDDKGFLASISPRGELNWAKYYDNVFTVLDLVESNSGFVLVGGTPGKIFPKNIWLARIGASGEVLESQMRQGPTRYAYLADDGQRLGLIYEKLGSGLDTGSVLLELFADKASLRKMSSQTLFKGRVAVPFVLSGYMGSFTAAGIVEHGQLQLIEVDSDGRQVPVFMGELKAPEYVRFHSVEIIRGADADYLGGLRSRADGRRVQMELVFARIPSM